MSAKFRAYAEDELPNLEFRSTQEEALADAIARVSGERALAGSHPPVIFVEEVREAKLSDFIEVGQIISLLRENMQEKIGNDDALSDAAVVSALSTAIAPGLGALLDDDGGQPYLRIDGYIVLSRSRAERWWVQADDET